mmetsp:Transcript_39886/g.95439  ORF Transcript_39886/g.95439 Transcript_39886/m.95439 type:complete len:497 (-) Transcript_39886:1886-3376(-)
MRAAVGRGARPCRAHTREELAERDLVWIDADELGQLEEAEERPEHALEHLLLAPALLDRGELVEIADRDDALVAEGHLAPRERGAGGDGVVEGGVHAVQRGGREHRDLVDDDDVGRGEPHEAVRSLAALEPRVLERAVRVQQACRVDRVAADEPRRLGAGGEHDDPQPLAAPVHDEEAGDGRLAHAALAREEGVELLLAGLLEQRVGLVLRLLEHVWARRAGLVPRDDRHRCPLVALARRLLEPRCRSGRLLIARVADLVAQACRVDARLLRPVAAAVSAAVAVSSAGSLAAVYRPAQHVGSHGVEHRLHGVEHVLLGEHRLHALGREAAACRVSRDGLAQPVLSRGDHSAQLALPSQRAERVGGVRLDERLGRAVAPRRLEEETLVEVERAVLRREHPVVPHRPHARSGHHPLAVLVRPARLRVVDGHRVPVLAGQRDAAHPDVAALALLRRHVAPLLDLEGAMELGVEHGVEVVAVDDALGPARVLLERAVEEA